MKKNILELVTKTPIVELGRLKADLGLKADIFAKLESFNPGGSVKDRIALKMLTKARSEGIIQQDTVIIEPTSGNTGIGLAMVSAYLGYRLILVMPETMSIERRKLIAAYGAELVLTEGTKGMKGAMAKADELAKEIGNAFIPSQFENLANPLVHYETTGPEIWEDMDHHVDIFVSGIGTGGTISGAGRYLREQNPDIYIVAVEPSDSPVLSKGEAGPHKIQGLGAGFIPDTLNVDIYDEIITVTNEEAFETGRLLARKEAILAGISSGAALKAALILAQKPEHEGKNIVVVFPDTGERYLSTPLFEIPDDQSI